MAREMALAGVDPSELQPSSPSPQKPQGFSGWWKNIWYHYKPVILLGGLLVFLLGWALLGTLRADPADYDVVVVTEYGLYPDEVEALKGYIAASGRDVDGDGEIEVEINNLTPNYYDDMAPGLAHSDSQKLTSYLSTGEVMLFVFDERSYNGFMETVENVSDGTYTFFAPLETASSDYQTDEHYWNWKNDARRTEYGMGLLPEDMLFGVRTPEGTASGKDAVSRYEEGKAMLETLIASAKSAA